MHLPTAMLDILRTGIATAALATVAAGCASTQQDTAQAPFAGMGSRANPPTPTVQVIAPGTTPFAQPVQPAVAPQPVAAPLPEPVAPVAPPRTWECGPCGMG
jgi:hypothetical protein